jgi:hypothetical protein
MHKMTSCRIKSKANQKSLWKIGVAFGCVAAAVAGSTPGARADVLEQKWVAGQQLSYDFKLDGTLRFTTPTDTIVAGFPIGGMPLEMLLKGEGQTTLDTHEVDEFGTAVVVPKLERMQLKFNETTFNQNGEIGLRDGRANFSVNGQSMGPANMDVSRVMNSGYGLRFTKSLRVTGFEASNKEAAPKEAAPDAKPDASGKATLGVATMIQGMIARAIPPLLPVEDVSIGDSWTANVEWPTMPGAKPDATAKPREPIGKFDFKALAEEEVQGRKTWRIAVDGTLQAADLETKGAEETVQKQSAAAGQKFPFKLPALMTMAQKIKGDVWFDRDAGQIVKMDVRLNSSAEGRPAAGKPTDGTMNFNGRLLMDLRKISFVNAP